MKDTTTNPKDIPQITTVYEIRDTSDDACYFTMGVFLTLDKAKEALEKIIHGKERITADFDCDGHEKISIVEIETGLSHGSRTVYAVDREEYYDEETGEYLWRVKIQDDSHYE